jgi:hypothetical protein
LTPSAGFLTDHPGRRPWAIPEGGRSDLFTPEVLFLGRGDFPLEVVVARCASRPGKGEVRRLWERRQDHRPAPVLLVVLYPTSTGERAALCGPIGEDPEVVLDRDPGQAERTARAALAEPDRQLSVAFVEDALARMGAGLPGIHNSGMFFTHYLEDGVPAMAGWASAVAGGREVLRLRGQALVRKLGFDIAPLGVSSSVLEVAGRGTRAAVAVFLEEHETPDGVSGRFGGTSPISHALELADRHQLPYVVLTRGPQIRVYSARHRGVGQKGQAETFVEANLTLLPDDLVGFVPLLFGAEALCPGGTFEQILEQSRDRAYRLAVRLRDRVYDKAVPALAEALGGRHAGRPTDQDLADLYETVMVILFRLLFIAYGEDRGLLPYRAEPPFKANPLYRRQALKSLARDMADMANEGTFDPDPAAFSYWSQARGLWEAVDHGNGDLGVPPYNGGLFSSDPAISSVGGRIASLELNNKEFGPVLKALLVDHTPEEGSGPVDFASLSVREFGTIYEGLLESSLSVATTDLTEDRDGTYVPAKGRDAVKWPKGSIYLHDRSGGRKATGSYFTKPFAVEHLLDHALEPALDDHLARLQALIDAGDEHGAAEAFFDFRVADIAMGSGHFLVAAVDRIERRLSHLLARHHLAGVANELNRLRDVAVANLKDLAAGREIEHSTLLRRQIARRCIYGVDLNLIAVELARLAIWIHTFVPGLPLSFLDHNLIQGDSLTGIGTIEEAAAILQPGTGRTGTISLLRDEIMEPLNRAAEALGKLGRVSDASAAEIAEARDAANAARAAAEPACRLFDALVAHRLGKVTVADELGRVRPEFTDPHRPSLAASTVAELAEALKGVHFPVAFPEVFLRARDGFDCIVGNPPWEEATVEELGFWALRFPGLRSMSQADQRSEVARLKRAHPSLVAEYDKAVEEAETLRQVLVAGPYPGMGTGDPDLYKAFCWRFWHLVGEGGAIGVVLPRSALMAAGSAPWREAVLRLGAFTDTTLLLNRAGWVFDDAEHRYTVGLVSIRKGAEHVGLVRTRGPFSDLLSFLQGVAGKSAEFAVAEFVTWTTGAAFPLIPSREAADVFLKLRRHPRFDSDEHPWKARPVAELHATNDKGEMVLAPRPTRGQWPVYKGASFNLWDPDTGKYFACADPAHIKGYLQAKRLSQVHTANSAFYGMPDTWARDLRTLPCLHPRIAFRDITNRTNQRTVIACLVPPKVVITNKGPYFLFVEGNPRDEAFVLGVLSSIPLDWYARRVVEINVNFHLLNAFPIPNPEGTDLLRLRVAEIAGRLGAVDERYADWAAQVGVTVGSVTDPEEKEDLIAELDAAVALLYGLDEADVRVVFETFHEGWNCTTRLDAVLVHLRRLR